MTIFSKQSCILGEGPLWSSYYNQFFWLDIVENKIYAKSMFSGQDKFDKVWRFDFIPTALIDNPVNVKTIWIVADSGLFLFEPKTGNIENKIPFDLGENFRTNDAGVDRDGNLWVGVMEKQPSGLNGYVLKVSENGVVSQALKGVGIPNTLCWSNELGAMLISDSYQQKTFSVSLLSNVSTINDHPVIFDLSDTDGTPDGGAIDEEGNLWNANWGIHRVICHDLSMVRRQIDLNALQITSVCFGGESRDKLLITSATEGLSENQKRLYSDSGCCFLLNSIQVKGREPLGFAMKDKDNVS